MKKVKRLISAAPGLYQDRVAGALRQAEADRLIQRIWEHDHTLWDPDPAEISNRLGWLGIIESIQEQVPRILSFVDGVRSDGFKNVLLLGMGGSSLAAEVFQKTFPVKEGHPGLTVLDSTDPAAVLAQRERLDLEKTLFIVSTKSGGTVETLSFFKYFYNQVFSTLGAGQAGRHFVAITDPGSKLVDLSSRFGFRELLLNDPDIGGRFSALSFFGLLPAALQGVDIQELLERARTGAEICRQPVSPDDTSNPGALLGMTMAELALAGRDKLTLVLSPAIESFGDWLEQLVAESTGKQGRGILPVVREPLGSPDDYQNDRLFVHLRPENDIAFDEHLRELAAAGHPLVTVNLTGSYDLGAQFFIWEFATAVAGYRLGINPFDQPDVEAAKRLARQMTASYRETGSLPVATPAIEDGGVEVFSDLDGSSAGELINRFLARAQPGAYASLQAYLPPTPGLDAALLALRNAVRRRTKLATTSGHGPRYLHSTGQLHKGDAGRGLFIQFTAEDLTDLPIPDQAGAEASSISFGILKDAQALGDAQALKDAGRQVIRFHFKDDPAVGMAELIRALE